MKTRLFKSISCLFLLTLMALHVAAQDKVKLSGRVIDDEQNPVLFAVVKVDGQAAGTTTDLQGRYQLEFSTADTVTVSFSMIGYVTKKKTLVRPKGSLRLNITMQTQSIDMGEVTVKEVRRQMNSTQHLNAENLKRLPSTTGNAVEELVATQAGVSTHNELSSQYNVRGGSFDENKGGLFKNVFKTPESSLSVDCEAVQCIYNDNRHCAAAKIGIAGDGASRAEQTLCTTFQMS